MYSFYVFISSFLLLQKRDKQKNLPIFSNIFANNVLFLLANVKRPKLLKFPNIQ